MSLVKNLKDRFVDAIAKSPSAERMIQQFEREAIAADAVVKERQAHVDRLHELRRAKREDLPQLVRAQELAEEKLVAARKVEEEAEQVRNRATTAVFDFQINFRNESDRLETSLIGSADQRIRTAFDTVNSALLNFHHMAVKLIRRGDEKVLLDPHATDPDAWWMKAQNARYVTRRFGSNLAAVEGIRDELAGAQKELRRLACVADAPADLDEQLARLTRWCGPLEPPEMVWTEPKAPTFTPAKATRVRENRVFQ